MKKHHRGTFLSLGSLSGRLNYGIVLIGLGFFENLDNVLTFGAAIGIASVALLFAANFLVGRDDLDRGNAELSPDEP